VYNHRPFASQDCVAVSGSRISDIVGRHSLLQAVATYYGGIQPLGRSCVVCWTY
jgi:hypothetical protein